MAEDFEGCDLIDNTGEKVGAIDRSYVDDSGTPRFLAVSTGTLLHKHHLVPAESAETIDGAVRVPYTQDAIVESPTMDPGDTLEGDALQEIRQYYRSLDEADFGTAGGKTGTGEADPEAIETVSTIDERNRPANDLPDHEIEAESAPADFGQVRDLGDVIEIPIVEEVIVKKPVVREVLRVRKSHLSERGIAAADLRKEAVEVVSSGDSMSHVSDDIPVRDEESSDSR